MNAPRKSCRACGTSNSADSNFCKHCAAQLSPAHWSSKDIAHALHDAARALTRDEIAFAWPRLDRSWDERSAKEENAMVALVQRALGEVRESDFRSGVDAALRVCDHFAGLEGGEVAALVGLAIQDAYDLSRYEPPPAIERRFLADAMDARAKRLARRAQTKK
jgi:hypothetical protein